MGPGLSSNYIQGIVKLCWCDSGWWWLPTDDATRAILSWWSSFRWWSRPLWARWWYRSCKNVGAGVLWSCWRQYRLLDHWHWRGNGCHWDGAGRVGWQGGAQDGKGGYQGVEEGLKVLNWNLHLFQLFEIIQVLNSISWVRCASGNV